MPGGYAIDMSRSLVLSRGWGVVTGGLMLAHAEALAADPRFRPDMRQLTDLRAVTDLDITAATIRQLAALSPFGPGARRALIVGSDYVYGMARMFQILRERAQDDLGVFRTAPEAVQWLGLEAESETIMAALEDVPGWLS